MARSEAARCRAERAWLPEVTQKLQEIETQGYDALDFMTRMAAGGDRHVAVETERWRIVHQIERCLLELAPCPDPKNRMGKRQEHECQHYRAQLVRDQERLADLEERGNEAVSAYDLRMGYDAEFNKQLKRNHIIYDLTQLERCPKPLVEMTPTIPVTIATPTVQEPRTRKKPAEPMTGYKQGSLF